MRRTRRRRWCRSSSTPMYDGCCWRRSPTSRARWRSTSTAAGWSTRSGPAPTPEKAHLLLEMLTPIAKSWPSQWCLAANDLAIQVHGGYGYTREYPVEQLYRDNRLNPIHEGTHGIQALDLLGRKVVMQGGAGLALLAVDDRRDDRARRRSPGAGGGAAGLGRPRGRGDAEGLGRRRRGAVAGQRVGLPRGGRARGDRLDVAGAAAGVRRARRARSTTASGRRRSTSSAWELPKTGPQLDLLASLDRTTLDMPLDAF